MLHKLRIAFWFQSTVQVNNVPSPAFIQRQKKLVSLVIRLDLENLHGPVLLSVQSFGSLVVPPGLVLLGPDVAQYHSLASQHALQIMSCDGLCFRVGLRLDTKNLLQITKDHGTNKRFVHFHGFPQRKLKVNNLSGSRQTVQPQMYYT